METYDVVVIGGGPGGYPAAIRAAQLGASVAIVEKEDLGGTCLNHGCIPTKTLIASSDLFDRMRHAEQWGLAATGTTFDYAAVTGRKNQIVEKLRNGVAQLLKANGVDVFHGAASFESRNRIRVSPDNLIESGATIIASGSVSAMPGFLPTSKRVMDSRSFLALSKLPSRLVVLGGGVIGCEFACMAAQFGVAVTVVEMLDDILMPVDPDLRRVVKRHMEKALGARVLTGHPLENISADKSGVRGTAGKESVEGDCLLVATGRAPMTKGLGLDKAGLETMDTGHIEVDEFCQTRAATIFAVGDVTTGAQLAHRATSQGATAAENACGKTLREAETLIPACIFTSPEIGSVGLTEQEAKESGRDVRTGKFMLAGLGKAWAAGESEGFAKWVVDPETDQLLGAHVVGAHATELISEATAAIRAELTTEEIGRTVHCHPTFSEAWMEAAHACHGRSAHQPPPKRR